MSAVERRSHPAEAADTTSSPPRFVFAIGRVRATVVVSLRGELAGPAVEQLEGVLDDLIRGQGNLTVVVDLRDLSGLDPGALGLFSDAADWAREQGGAFRLQEASSLVSAVFQAAGEARGLDLVDDSPRVE